MTSHPYKERSVYVRSVVINNRLYIFANLSPEGAARQEGSCVVKIVDFSLRRMFGVDMTQSKPENRPSAVRLNYSLAHYKHKVFIYGGINQANEVLGTIDDFDATTYKFTHVKIRGEMKPRGRQAHCAVAID